MVSRSFCGYDKPPDPGYGKGSFLVHALPLLPLDQWDPNLDFLGMLALFRN